MCLFRDIICMTLKIVVPFSVFELFMFVFYNSIKYSRILVLEQLFIQAFLLLSLVPDDNGRRYVSGLVLFENC